MEERGLPVATHLLQHTLRSLCMNSHWVYAVFWRILPRSYPPPKWDSDNGIYDRSKGNKRNWILVWEDGFCDFGACARAAMEVKAKTDAAGFRKTAYAEDDLGSVGLQPELFFKMSHEVYNFGEGLMGKVAADNSHKWIFRDPLDHEVSFLSPWHNSIDPHPRTWESQFKAGIQTIAVIAVREGLVQLGATKKVIEDLNFVILLQRKFNYLQTIPGVFLPHPSISSCRASQDQYNNNKNNDTNNQRHLEKCLSWNGTATPDRLKRDQIMMMMMMSNNAMMMAPPPALMVMPSMSSLEALLSKLPSVTSSSTPPLNMPNGFLGRSLSCPRESFSGHPSILMPHPQTMGTEDHENSGTEAEATVPIPEGMDFYLREVVD